MYLFGGAVASASSGGSLVPVNALWELKLAKEGSDSHHSHTERRLRESKHAHYSGGASDDGDDEAKGSRWVSLDHEYGIVGRPRPRYGHIAAATGDGLLLIHGGFSGIEYFRDLWAIRVLNYTTSTSSSQFRPFIWRELMAARSPPGLHFAAGAVVDRYWYVFGGQMSDGFGSQETWLLDLSDLTAAVMWVSLNGVGGPTGRVGHAMCSTAGGLLMFGGLDMEKAGTALLNDLWFFSLPQRVWRLLSAPTEGAVAPLPRVFMLANTVGSHLVVLGGARATPSVDSGGAVLGKEAVYDLDEDMWRWDGKVWRFIGRMRSPVMVGGVSYLPSIGKIFLYGGLAGVKSFTSWATTLRAANALGYDRMYGPAAFRGVVTDNVSREVQILYLDTCNETTDFPCLPCSRGQVRKSQLADAVPWTQSDDSCVSCPEGTIQYGAACVPCPAGFFGPFAGMDSWRMCVPCEEGTGTFSPGKGECVPCGDTNFGPCPVMSARPDAILAPAGVFELNEPHGSINAMIIHETAQWFNVLYVFCTLALFILLIFLAHARAPNRIDKCLISLDFRPITGTPPVLPGNPAGGLRIGGVIFICYIAIVSVIFVRAVEKFVTNNTVISSYSVPTEEAVSDSGPLRTDFSVNVTLRGSINF
jgi:hypothetical protein